MKLLLEKSQEEVTGVTTFMFTPQQPVEWKAGQFMTYHLEDANADERGENRFFTISSAPFEKQIWITTRIDPEKSSTFKKNLLNLKPGETIEANGPKGGFVVEDPGQRMVFIAGGIGITPFRSIIKELEHQNTPFDIVLLYANRDENIVFKDEFDGIAQKNPGLKIQYFTGDQKIDEAVLKNLTEDAGRPVFYISGPQPMVESFEKMLNGLGVEDARIKTDYFPGYTAI